MSVTASTTDEAVPAGLGRRRRPRRLLAGGAVLLLAAGAVLAVTRPFSGGAGSSAGPPDNGSATGLATVTRQSLTSQTQVDGTLGYAGSSSIVAPAGTAPADVQKAQQSVASAQGALQVARAALSADTSALAQARAKLAADRRKLASDCAGTGAAGSGSTGSGSGASSPPCATTQQTVTGDAQAVVSAEQKVTSDGGTVASAQVALTAAQQSLVAAESSALAYGAAATYTMLPSAGSIVRRGGALYAVDGQPVLLLYGPVTAWRAFRPGMSPGRDVAELNENLRALGYGGGLGGDAFTGATGQAVRALQAARGLPQTGVLALGSVVFKPGPIRVTSATPTVGLAVQAGQVLATTSVRHQVAIKLDAAQQTDVKVGDAVTITLPSGRTTPGNVSSVGTVATVPSGSDSGSSSTPTVDVDVRLLRQAAAGRLDQAPVQVAITTGSVDDALVVPVNALLALAGGGYAVEVVDAAGAHRLVPVTLGLFDDAEGLVQVSGSGLRAGERIVVPAS